jgi:serine/threonine protein kinase
MVSVPLGSRLGRYHILERLGRGGMATVYKARDPVLDRYVAVKVLPSLDSDDPTYLDRFTQEAQAIARLKHPNIIQVYDFGEDSGYTYIVAEYVPGGTLQNVVGAPLPPEEAIKYLRPLAEALDYAHSQGIVHRDIKPSNVLIDSNAKPILADFGLSRMSQYTTRMTATNQVLGTPEYMAPEQALGAPASYKSDLYALGILAYELLVGSTPFHAETPAATLLAHVNQPLSFPNIPGSQLSPGVKAVLLKVTAKDPKDRYSSALEMVRALEQAASQASNATAQRADETVVAPVISSEAASAGRAGARARWRRIPFLPELALIGVIGIAAASVFFLRGGGNFLGNDKPAGTPSPIPVSATTPGPVVAPVVETPTPEASATPPIPIAEALAALKETTSKINSRIATLRKLSPQRPIEPELRTRQQLVELGNGLFDKRYLREQLLQAEQLYKALGMLNKGDDLKQITRDILLQQVAALYDDESERLYVLSDAPAIGPVEEMAYASVYMAGIQQQRFKAADLRQQARDSGNSDYFRALTAFLSGEVAQIQRGYATFFLTPDELEILNKPLPTNPLATAPHVVKQVALLPQREGSRFVASIYSVTNDWESVNSVYARPPVSTEQILHPDKYLDGEEPVIPELPDLGAVLGRGWELIAQDTMGEFLLRTYLEDEPDAVDASSAAAGWGGDRYALFLGPEGERLLAMVINWDTPQDCAEFHDAFGVFAEKRTGRRAIALGDRANERWWIAPEQTLLLRKDEPRTLLIVSDKETMVRQVLEKFPDS